MPAADLLSVGRRFGLTLATLAVGMVLGGALTAGLRSSSAEATDAIGPDVGDIRVAATSAGPHDKVDGVGVGFTGDEAGAVAAATNLVLTLEQAGTADRSRAVRAYEVLAADASSDELGRDMAATWDALHGSISSNGPAATSLFLRTVPVGHELVRYAPGRATVSVWTLTVVAAAGMVEPVSSWETATVELVWEDEDWKVWSASSEGGPTPAWAEVTPSSTDGFLDDVDSLGGYRYVSD